ncbi:hypothetical protein CerSpe_104340 [Prunus speciosa]
MGYQKFWNVFSYYLSATSTIFHCLISVLFKTDWDLMFFRIPDTLVALYFRLCGLSPCTIDIDDQTTKHFWTANHRRFNKPVWFWFSVYDLSYGGLVAYQMAEMYPEMVEKVVIVSSGVVWTDEQKDELLSVNSDALEILLPKSPHDLRLLVNRSVYKYDAFKWVP